MQELIKLITFAELCKLFPEIPVKTMRYWAVNGLIRHSMTLLELPDFIANTMSRKRVNLS